MTSKVFVSIFAVVVIGVILYVVVARTQSQSAVLPTGTITLSGETVCLPVKDPSQPHIELCAIGLKATDGKYYGLKSQSEIFETDMRLKVTGTLTSADPESIYAITAEILVESFIKE